MGNTNYYNPGVPQPSTIPQVWTGNGQQPSAYVRPSVPVPTQVMPPPYSYDASYGQTPTPVPEVHAMEFIESKEAAEAFRRPAGWPANTPIPLWDGAHNYVYFKSWSPIGMANPLVRARVIFENDEAQQQPVIPMNTSGAPEPQQNYVTKSDFEQLEQKMMGMLQQMQNQRPVQQPQMNQQNQNETNQGRNGGGRNA